MKKRPNRWLRAIVNLAIVVALLMAASFLPPDTSLDDRRKAGRLKVCVPPSYPPLVTGDPARPGFDIELTQAIADRLGLRLSIASLASIGSDFNPRNWSLTRGQCDIVAGGVADTVQTRSFLETVPTLAQTGWVGLSKTGHLPEKGSSVAVLPGTSGLSRIELSGWIREQGYRAVPARNTQQFVEALAGGRVEAGITEHFVAASLPRGDQLRMFWLPEERFPRFSMALGLWKGDQTLKRAVNDAIADIDSSGDMAGFAAKYGL